MPKKTLSLLVLFLVSLLCTSTSFAHHAKEFLRTESYAQAPKGGLVFFSGFDYFKPSYDDSGLDEWEYTPTLLYGISDRLMLGVHTHLLHIQNESAFFEAFAFGLQYQITEPNAWLIDVGLNVEYEIPFQKSRDLIDGKQIVAGTLILSKELPGDINVTSNIHYAKEVKHGDDDELNISLAGKGYIVPSWDWMEAGLELLGTVEDNPSFVIVPGVYMSLSEDVVFKTGASFGLNDHSEDLALHFVLAYTVL